MSGKLGDGSRFRAIEESAAKSGARDTAAVAAAAGIKKYGKDKMESMSRAGKRRHKRGTGRSSGR